MTSPQSTEEATSDRRSSGSQPRCWKSIQAALVLLGDDRRLLKQGPLSEELAFDTVLDAPPWPIIERFIRDLRVEREEPTEGENIEYAHERAMAFAAGRRND